MPVANPMCLFVCLSVSLYCDITAHWIWMLFGVISGIGREIGVLYGSGDRQMGRGSFGGKCGASHCNQWDSLCEGWRRRSSQITLEFSCIGRQRRANNYVAVTRAMCASVQVANCTRCYLCISEPRVFNTQPAEMEMSR